MFLLANTRFRSKIGAVRSIGAPPPSSGAFPPDGAVWWYSKNSISNETIDNWNADAVAYSFPANQQTLVDLKADGMPRNLSLKNKSTNVRVGKTGTYRGVIRACRRHAAAPAADPTGGPNDVADAGGNNGDPAHALLRMLTAGDNFQTIPYGQLFEIGFDVMIPDGADGDGATTGEHASIICELESSNHRTGEAANIRVSHPAAHNQFIFQSCLMPAYDQTLERTFKGNVMVASGYRNAVGGPLPNTPSDAGFPYNYNQWYKLKVRGVVDFSTDAKSWFKWFINDMVNPVAWVNNIRAGKYNDGVACNTISLGSYGVYTVPSGKRLNVYFDNVYLKLGETGFPGPSV